MQIQVILGLQGISELGLWGVEVPKGVRVVPLVLPAPRSWTSLAQGVRRPTVLYIFFDSPRQHRLGDIMSQHGNSTNPITARSTDPDASSWETLPESQQYATAPIEQLESATGLPTRISPPGIVRQNHTPPSPSPNRGQYAGVIGELPLLQPHPSRVGFRMQHADAGPPPQATATSLSAPPLDTSRRPGPENGPDLTGALTQSQLALREQVRLRTQQLEEHASDLKLLRERSMGVLREYGDEMSAAMARTNRALDDNK
ncbi:hypothetical protein OH76DRAFT_1424118, partial [Lentinus brumalis]